MTTLLPTRIHVLIFFGVVLFAAPAAALAREVPYSEIRSTDISKYSVEDLVAKGCVVRNPRDLFTTDGIIDVPDDKPKALRSLDNQVDYDIGYEVLSPLDGYWNSYTFCSHEVFAAVTSDPQAAAKPTKDQLEIWETALITGLNWLFWMFGQVGTWLLLIASQFLGLILGAKFFITNPLVRTGWPFIQGIANIGFILALLFIALATTLRIEGYNVRRTLPRLLLAAVFINFSLVIGGVIIDGTRVLMAIMADIVGINNLERIGDNLLKSSDVISGVYDLTTFKFVSLKVEASSWEAPLKVLQATILIWGLASGIFVITVGLIARYIALLLLLIVSPVAYLAFALPNTSNLAKQWWTQFLRWVFYGPIALFILLLLIVIGSTNNILNQDIDNEFLPTILNIATVAVLCIVAHKAGSSLGGIGGAAAVSFATNLRNRTARGAGKTVSFLSRPFTRRVRDFGKEVRKPIDKKLGLGKYGIYDGKGKLKEGKSSIGSRAGEALGRYIPGTGGETKRADINNARNASQARDAAQSAGTPWAPAALQGNAALSPEKLIRSEVIANLSADTLNDLITNGSAPQKQSLGAGLSLVDNISNPQLDAVIDSGDVTILQRVANNINLVDNMSDSQKAKIVQVNNTDLTRDLFRTIGRVERRNQSNK